MAAVTLPAVRMSASATAVAIAAAKDLFLRKNRIALVNADTGVARIDSPREAAEICRELFHRGITCGRFRLHRVQANGF